MIEVTDAEQVERLNSRVMELLRERDALVKALEFYAEPKNYSDDYWKGMWEPARAALAAVSSTKEPS